MGKSVVTKDNQDVQIQQITANPYVGMMEVVLSGQGDISTFEKLIALQSEFEAKQAKKAFNNALAEFQSDIPKIEKTGHAKFRTTKGVTEYTFCKMEDITEAIKPSLQKFGLSYRFTQHQENGALRVTCIVSHSAGHEETTTLFSNLDSSGSKNAIQQIGSTITYLRRYTLTGALGLASAEIDNDAEDYESQEEIQHQDRKQSVVTEELESWKKMIDSGERTMSQITIMLNKNNIQLTDEQLDYLRG